MHGDSSWIWGWPVDGEDPKLLLGQPIRDGQIRALIWHPNQGPLRGHKGGSYIPHHIEHGG